MRRPPAKRRGWIAPRIGGHHARPGTEPNTTPPGRGSAGSNEPPGYSSHLGGQFDETGYGDQRWDGYFGFAPKPDWPVERRDS